ncbi:hypothetical protein [Porphyromonas gingivalis]|uniref:Uncharacterized protein n=1 Tax=Porphyromonas gingivalis TaxID=837 RepID=A0AAE9X8Q8_PORGN|nr:hypothetical protein [Porphyromonas gingivalis]WCG00110.1 hypothetical protein NY149_01170 [Porphyromonas gingivalis]WIM92378.1 hypothetical protein QP877_01170 [Porphyromonas gingivalis]
MKKYRAKTKKILRHFIP